MLSKKQARANFLGGTLVTFLIVGGIFSALEPTTFLTMAVFAVNMYRKKEN